jgi:hypothetical protein
MKTKETIAQAIYDLNFRQVFNGCEVLESLPALNRESESAIFLFNAKVIVADNIFHAVSVYLNTYNHAELQVIASDLQLAEDIEFAAYCAA